MVRAVRYGNKVVTIPDSTTFVTFGDFRTFLHARFGLPGDPLDYTIEPSNNLNLFETTLQGVVHTHTTFRDTPAVVLRSVTTSAAFLVFYQHEWFRPKRCRCAMQ
jgi:hypothetical protein